MDIKQSEDQQRVTVPLTYFTISWKLQVANVCFWMECISTKNGITCLPKLNPHQSWASRTMTKRFVKMQTSSSMKPDRRHLIGKNEWTVISQAAISNNKKVCPSLQWTPVSGTITLAQPQHHNHCSQNLWTQEGIFQYPHCGIQWEQHNHLTPNPHGDSKRAWYYHSSQES